MEARLKEKGHIGLMASDLNSVGKKGLEWDPNGWRWDGDLFTASPLNPVESECRSRQFFPVRPEYLAIADFNNCSSSVLEDVQNELGKREAEKRRRVAVDEDEEWDDEPGGFNLNIGGQGSPTIDSSIKGGKKIKSVGPVPNGPACQVEGCRADLSSSKDYHRRHKVCEMHSKASEALVGHVMQRFCQQCSRFHVLQEFDEGKRSCRRRLAGHNRRRRKTHPEMVAGGGSLGDEKGSHYLLVSLLRILSNMHSSSLDPTKDQDLLSHLLRNLASTIDGQRLSDLLQESKGALVGSPDKVVDVTRDDPESAKASMMNTETNCQDSVRSVGHLALQSVPDLMQRGMGTDSTGNGNQQPPTVFKSTGQCLARDDRFARVDESNDTTQRIRMRDIDLNSSYEDTQGFLVNTETCNAPEHPGTSYFGSLVKARQGADKSSPPHTSSMSNSTSTESPSSASGEAQCRTGRIVFKLFGKDPDDLPLALRTQILNWLSHSPTDMESYIRPGCIILTIYLCLEKTMWRELHRNLSSTLRKLLDGSNDSFWQTGWIYTRVQDFVSFIYNGEIILGTPLPLGHNSGKILSIKPIAVSVMQSAEFVVKGFNLFKPTSKLYCALEGKYLAQKSFYGPTEEAEMVNEDKDDEIQFLSFCCSVPETCGRGFIEVEDHGLSCSFFPFVVAEEEVCSEIRMLESEIEALETPLYIKQEPEMAEARSKALDFINEIGWLLHRSHVKRRLGDLDHNVGLFPFRRFKWLMEFAMEHNWCAVVKKLLGICFNGVVDAGEHPSIDLAMLEMNLLHRAVRRNCRAMVEFLLRYIPREVSDKAGLQQAQQISENRRNFLFKANAVGPAGLTPLHIAASSKGFELVLDALTNDPLLVGVEAWKSARDDSGLTPNDYACLRGHFSYIHLVQRKSAGKSDRGHVILDVPTNPKQKPLEGPRSTKTFRLESNKTEHGLSRLHCKLCEQKIPCRSTRTSLVARPAMVSLVAIAAVCVCAALLFKSLPKVRCTFHPFLWEDLKYGWS
ncbi:hypothetical protein NL676_020567 [Syzygium grande]|nr:hypothetical protein NL676_020567 [Syzygium grande]